MGILEKEEERKNVLNILKNTKKALITKDAILLKELSNRTIHSASIYKDVDSVVIAVTIYALSKIIERKKYETFKEWPSFFSHVTDLISKAYQSLEKKDFQAFHTNLKNIRKIASNLSGHLKIYIQDIFNRASINKASRIYEHGISMEETANLLDITPWELAEYVGKTGIADVDLSITMPIKERISYTKKLFEY